MSFVRGRNRNGSWLACAVALWPALAWAQPEVRAYDLSPNRSLRSPRILGMGGLTLADDHSNRITLWDFAGNPAGIQAADTSSVIELRPGTGSASGRRDRPPAEGGGEREYLAARTTQTGFEAWRRGPESAYGLYGDFDGARADVPYGDAAGRRGAVSVPRVVGVLNGRMPYIAPDRVRVALRLFHINGHQSEEYRTLVRNRSGEYLSLSGQGLPPPNFFTPVTYRHSTFGGGGAFSYRFGPWLTAAVGADGSATDIDGENSGPRYFSGTTEKRPYGVGQVSLIGAMGTQLQWGADARGWISESEERFVFTLAGGIGQEPLAGRGRRLARDEEGSLMRSRVRWTSGPLELGASLDTRYRKVTIVAPDPSRPGYDESFNYFRNALTYRQGSDSLALPDSVASHRDEERGWLAAVGTAYRLGERGRVGLELHAGEDRRDHSIAGSGPLRKSWDARAGLEYPCAQSLLGRLGYAYGKTDLDDFTERNEFVGHTVTAGAGIAPAGTAWGVDIAYAIEWLTPDYGDPSESRESRQQLALLLRWAF